MRYSSITSVSDTAFVGTTANLREKLHQVLTVLDNIPAEAPPLNTQGSSGLKERDVRAIIRARRDRARFFSEELFADPAWDILLELYAAELGQRRTSVSSACIGSAVPATTALRWIKSLEKRGLIIRHDDRFDGRRVYVGLSPEGLRSMEAYFANTPAAVPTL